MWICPLCGDSFVITSKLCEDCDKVHKLFVLYGKEKLYKAINKCFLVGEKGQEIKLKVAQEQTHTSTSKSLIQDIAGNSIRIRPKSNEI